jgi:thiol-disulfide isomerase/thioredoxin/RNase H-fold protein (predicted Holliday junction resolvase)
MLTMNKTKNSKSNSNSNNLSMKVVALISLAFVATTEVHVQLVYSFTPIQWSSSSKRSSSSLIRTGKIKLFQSASVACPMPTDDYTDSSSSSSSYFNSSMKELNRAQQYSQDERNRGKEAGRRSSSCSVSVVRQLDADTCTESTTTTEESPPTTTKEDNDQLIKLQSMSIIELKLECSKRNIQYGKFVSKKSQEEYIDSILKDMEYTVTGLIRPGTMVELTGEQINQEITNENGLILVDVFATWCGPCRVIIPQLIDFGIK